MNSAAIQGRQIDWEAALLERARQGDVRAFERLYREFVGRVYGLCLRLVRHPADAEDCTQQTFINAWSALARFEARSSFATWLHRIAVNVVLSRRQRTTLSIEILSVGPEEMESDWTFDTSIEVSEIEAAIVELPDGARDVLVLSGIYGYSHAETAAMLGVAEGTCKAQLHRARQLLRERLCLEGY